MAERNIYRIDIEPYYKSDKPEYRSYKCKLNKDLLINFT